MKNIFIVCLGVMLLASCSESQKSVNIALKKGGKAYLYSIVDKATAEQQLAKGEMPTMMNNTALVPDGGQLFMDASKIKTIVNVLGGNIELLPKQETSFDGYFVEGDEQLFAQTMKNKDAGEIGKIASIVEVTLTDKAKSKTYPISWQVSPELKALENCEVQSLTVKYSPNSEGEYTSKDFVVVNLEDINQFFGGVYSLHYDKEASLLYLEEE